LNARQRCEGRVPPACLQPRHESWAVRLPRAFLGLLRGPRIRAIGGSVGGVRRRSARQRCVGPLPGPEKAPKTATSCQFRRHRRDSRVAKLDRQVAPCAGLPTPPSAGPQVCCRGRGRRPVLVEMARSGDLATTRWGRARNSGSCSRPVP
jgi:hypothetical protein